jgi:acyl-CoA synthetase (AMP-forming)/AMP-acid ligase II
VTARPAAGTVPGLLALRAGQEPDRTAVETYGLATLTFAEWDRRATAVAAGLVDRGVARQSRVGLVFGNATWHEFAVAYCGVLRAGAVAVPCSDALPRAELSRMFGRCAVGVVLHAATAPVDALGPAWTATVGEVELPGDVDVTVRPADIAQILHTSGTGGRPKGVSATHANLAFGAATHPRRRPLAHSERFLHAFPVGTNAGQTMLMNALVAHPAAVTMPRFTPARFARLIEEHEVGSAFVVPAMAIEMLNSGALDRHDLSRLRLLGSTAAALPSPVAVRLAAALPNAVIVNYYTSTEAAPAQTTMVFDPNRPGAVGRAVDGVLRIGDDPDRPVPPGTAGEVWLRSPHPRAYLEADAADRAVFRDGWVRMGDLGRLDQDGYLYLVDRDTDVIKSGAHRVSTLWVEESLHRHSAVAEAAAVGLPHPVLGTVVAAVVVPRAGAPRAELTTTRIRDFLRPHLADHELPSRVAVVDRLPRNEAGKVNKRELRERFADGVPEGDA